MADQPNPYRYPTESSEVPVVVAKATTASTSKVNFCCGLATGIIITLVIIGLAVIGLVIWYLTQLPEMLKADYKNPYNLWGTSKTAQRPPVTRLRA